MNFAAIQQPYSIPLFYFEKQTAHPVCLGWWGSIPWSHGSTYRDICHQQNKQQFIFMLSEALQKKNCETHHASGDADLLIVLKAIQSATTTNTVLVGDDTDLIVLLCYHASMESHDLFFRPEPKRNTKNPRI